MASTDETFFTVAIEEIVCESFFQQGYIHKIRTGNDLQHDVQQM